MDFHVVHILSLLRKNFKSNHSPQPKANLATLTGHRGKQKQRALDGEVTWLE